MLIELPKLENNRFVELYFQFEGYYKDEVEKTHVNWVCEHCKNSKTPRGEYDENMADIIIYMKDQPSLIKKQFLDMRFIFKTKNGGYSFINPVVKAVFADIYLSIDAIERFVRDKHYDYTGSFFGYLFEMYLKRKLLGESQKIWRFKENFVMKFQHIYENGMSYKNSGKNLEFMIPDLQMNRGFFLFPSQQNFPIYEMTYKSEDSHIFCIAIRSEMVQKEKFETSFSSTQHLLSPNQTNLMHPIDKLFNHYADYQNKLGKLFFKYKNYLNCRS